jgi:hypothetical protein
MPSFVYYLLDIFLELYKKKVGKTQPRIRYYIGAYSPSQHAIAGEH